MRELYAGEGRFNFRKLLSTSFHTEYKAELLRPRQRHCVPLTDSDHGGNSPLSKTSRTDPVGWVDAHGQILYRYALARVRRPELAEDLVQETFLAALKSMDQFQGRSTERTWLTGILKHKVLDCYRAQGRSLPECTTEQQEKWLSEQFDERGHWLKSPDPRAIQPESLVEREEFWAVFEGCLNRLGARAREAFVRRVVDGEEIEPICNALSITATNLYVILFRARTQMRHCLTLKWFQE